MERGRLAATLCPAGARAAADRALPSMLRRVRWGNVGRLAALVAAGALIASGVHDCGAREQAGGGWGGRVEAIEVAGSPVLFVREVEAFEASVLDGIASVVSLDDSRSAAATLSTLLDSARDASAMYPE